jgi:hypothetical protein
VVPKDSAVIGLNNEVSMPLNGDHRSIAQMHNFTRGDCNLFQHVVCELMAQTALETRKLTMRVTVVLYEPVSSSLTPCNL